MTHELSRFAPAKLFPSAVEEILFGSGTFVIGLSGASPTTFTRLLRQWDNYLLDQSLGAAFRVVDRHPYIRIVLSPAAFEAFEALKLDRSQVQDLGMREGTKAHLLVALETSLKEIL